MKTASAMPIASENPGGAGCRVAEGLERAGGRALAGDARTRLFEPAFSTHRVEPASFASAPGGVRTPGSPAGAVRGPQDARHTDTPRVTTRRA